MNEFFEEFMHFGPELAEMVGVTWDLNYDDTGAVRRSERWNLNEICHLPHAKHCVLSSVGFYEPAIEPLNSFRTSAGRPPIQMAPMPESWIRFHNTVLLHGLVVKKLKPDSVMQNICRMLKILATCASSREPWELTGEDARLAYNVALRIGKSGKVAMNVKTVLKTVFDLNHLSNSGPLAPSCTPYADETSQSCGRQVERQRLKEKIYRAPDDREKLDDRLNPDTLPDETVMLELARILWTERPTTISDRILFNLLKIGCFTGLRVGELLTLPLDCLVEHDHFDYVGRPAGDLGGISKSLSLRYFAEKTPYDEDLDGIVYHEDFQDVPPRFEREIRKVVADTIRLTSKMRNTYRRQIETDRLLPDLHPDDIIPASEAYLRISGNIRLGYDPLSPALVEKYQADFSTTILDGLRRQQYWAYQHSPNFRIAQYFQKWKKKSPLLKFRDENGTVITDSKRINFYLRVSDIEAYVRDYLPSKRPVLDATALSNGELHDPSENLFLFPSRSTIEDRDGGVLDIAKYACCGPCDTISIWRALGDDHRSLFRRFGGSEEAKRYSLNPHALRHMMNHELFRLGVSDTDITNHFGRHSPAQSQAYNHRSLAEDLRRIDVPSSQGTAAPAIKKLFQDIMAGKLDSPLVREVKRIQAELGHDEALEYLLTEGGGAHSTPYGICLSSLTANPCAKHLRCYDDCRHLARTADPAEAERLEDQRRRHVTIIDAIDGSKVRGPGVQNQLRHAESVLKNIERALATAPGELVTPDGTDHYEAAKLPGGGCGGEHA